MGLVSNVLGTVSVFMSQSHGVLERRGRQERITEV
jgi:hypothetical protein